MVYSQAGEMAESDLGKLRMIANIRSAHRHVAWDLIVAMFDSTVTGEKIAKLQFLPSVIARSVATWQSR